MENNLKEYYEELLERKVDELKRRSDFLSSTLSMLVKKIDADGINTSINTCGECQSEARLIDDLCKEIGQIRNMLDMIKAFTPRD